MPAPLQVGSQEPPALGLWEYMRPIRARWFLGCAVAVTATVIGISIPQVLAWIVDHLVGSETPTPGRVWAGGALITVLGLAQAVLFFVRRMLVVDTAATVEMTMRMRLYDKLSRMPVSFHDRWPSGQLLTRSTSDMSMIRRWISFGSIQSVTSALAILVGLFYLFRGSWLLGLIYTCSLPPTLLVLWFFIKRMKKLTRRSQQQSGDLATSVEESVQGIRVLKALGQGENALARFTDESAELMHTEIDRSKTLGSTFVKTSLLTGATMAISLLVGINEVANGQMTVGALTAFFATTAMLTPHVERSGMMISMYLDSKVAMDRHREIMSEPSGERVLLVPGVTTPVPGSEAGQPGSDVLPSSQPHQQAAEIRFEHADFSYEGSPTPVFTDLSLTVAPGEILALVGPTGCGKSTLLQLIPRLYSLTGGDLLVDGRSVAEMPLPDLRSQIAVAFEEPILFSSSVRDNVLVGVDRASKTEQELDQIVEDALRISASDFVSDLPDGVHTLIGEEGMSLSGGQRQRLSLARAIATRPRILLLDDPLSALDVKTEEAVVGMLSEHLNQTTVVITAHRPSTVALADRVALMQDGAIAATGRHSELMSNPDYARLMSLDADIVEEGDASWRA